MLRSRLFTTATSLDLSGIITDETGTGSLVFSISPTILTPIFNGTSTFTGLVNITNATASTSTTTGALQVAGGVGVGGAIYSGAARNVIGSVAVGEPVGDASGTILGNLAAASSSSGAIANTAIGRQALRFNTQGDNNTAVGAFALEGIAQDSVSSCAAFGWRAATVNMGDGVTAIGNGALTSNTLASGQTAVGSRALGLSTTSIGAFTTTPVSGGSGYTANQTGVTVTLVKKSGTDAFAGTVEASLTTNASGVVTAVAATPVSAGSSFTGSSLILEPSGFGGGSGCEISIASLVTSEGNTAVGFEAGRLMTSASNNTLVGHFAGDAITTGFANTGVGNNALGELTTGSNNVAIGRWANAGSTTGNGNVRIGSADTSTPANTTGHGNVGIGYGVNDLLTTGAYNIVIGSVNPGAQTPPGGNVRTGSGNIVLGRANVAATSDSTNVMIVPGIGVPETGDGTGTTVIGSRAHTTQARIYGGTFLSTGANGQSTQLGQSTTLLSALSGATVTATNLIPANCILLGVTARVTTAITGATTFDIGDGTTADRFGNDIAIALNTTANNCIAPALVTAATNVVLTANGSNFTGGAVRLTAHFITLVAPTS